MTSNYVYHNIAGKNKQELLLETLRVLKDGGTFVIHDLMSNARYGDMDRFWGLAIRGSSSDGRKKRKRARHRRAMLVI